ncbi:5296_t:CDS:2, partial [Racocetra fulgida]
LPIATTDNPYVNPLSAADSAFNLETNQSVADSAFNLETNQSAADSTFNLETNQSTADSTFNSETNQTNQPEPHNCISIEDINANKMPIEDPTNTLYIKNLSQRKIEDKELEYLFGRYFQSRSEMESQLGIQLLKGRMRGQAFIKLPSLEIATQALNELHGSTETNKSS